LTRHLRFSVWPHSVAEVINEIFAGFAPLFASLSKLSRVHSALRKVPYEFAYFSMCWYPSEFDSLFWLVMLVPNNYRVSLRQSLS